MNGGGYERILSKQKAKDEALAWFVRVNSGDAGDAELRAHRRWLAASDDNRAEYERISGIWSDFDKVADPRLPLTMRKPPLGRRPGRRAFLAGGLATAAGLAAVTAINGLPAGFLADYSTGTGEQRSLTLADGSTVNLDADTALVVKFNDRERRLLLLSGRAFFAVAKDAHRPFVVEAASGTATALGTRFSVHEWGGNASVAVEESAVSVTAPDGSSAVLNVGRASPTAPAVCSKSRVSMWKATWPGVAAS